MPETPRNAIAVVGVDIGKNSFHVIGLDRRGAIVLRQKWSRRQVESKRCFSPYFAALTLREDSGGARQFFFARSGRGPGEKLVEAVHRPEIDEAREHVSNVTLGIDIVKFAGFDKRSDDSPVLCAIVVACEESILSRQCPLRRAVRMRSIPELLPLRDYARLRVPAAGTPSARAVACRRCTDAHLAARGRTARRDCTPQSSNFWKIWARLSRPTPVSLQFDAGEPKPKRLQSSP